MRVARSRLESRLAAQGHSGEATAAAVRSLRWWLDARAAAARRRSGLAVGSTVVATGPGRVELVPIEVPLAGVGELTVEIDTTVVSPGTERAQYLRLPNAQLDFPYRPGYSGAGRVVAVGRKVENFKLGDNVAVPRVSHTSLVTVSAASAYHVPVGVPLEDAAFVYLAMISGYGVRRALLEHGAPLGIVGTGPIGALAHRLAALAGAGPTTVIAASRTRERVAQASGADRFLTANDNEEIGALEVPVVIEATGAPAAFATAVAAVARGGRIVLLGSTRGESEFSLLDVRQKRLEIVGAHISALAVEARSVAGDPFGELAETFLSALSAGEIQVDDLAEVVADPREAAALYRRLATDPAVVGARFDWTLLPAEDRRRQARFVARPDLRPQGLDPDVHPLPPPATSALVRARTPPSTFRLRIGLLGCGEIGAQNARAIAGARNAELVACFDPAFHLAQDVADRFGGVTCSSADELLAAELDAVLIATPHHLHASQAVQAIESGLHVMVEKPLARNTQEANEMVEAARNQGVLLSICFPFRYEAHAVAARGLIEAGALGQTTGAVINYASDKPPSYWLGGYSNRSSVPWRASRELAGGGVLIMNLCHYLDLVRHVAGLEAETVTAVVDESADDDRVEETVAVAIRYENGAVGSMFGCSALRGAAFSQLRIWGEAGHALLEPQPRLYTLRALDGVTAGRWHELPEPGPENVRTTYVERFAEAVHTGTAPDVPGEDGLVVQALMDAMYESARRGGQPVRPVDMLAPARP
jgi:2-desacetyl-2-hydroxyethyl bacteriochlorophyllide A dehydrogenase